MWKIVCERRRATKLCVKDGMWRSVCEEDGVKREAGGWCVTEMCVRELLTKIVWKMVCDNTLRQMVCDKDGMWQIGVWQRCVWDGLWNQGGCHIGVTQPKRATQCHKCHACHAKRRWMWDCATPATWNAHRCHQVPRQPRKSAAASRATKSSPSAPFSATSATPATQNEGGCEIVPHHATPATQKCRGVPGD